MLWAGVKLGMTKGCAQGPATGFSRVALPPDGVAGDEAGAVVPKHLPFVSRLALCC